MTWATEVGLGSASLMFPPPGLRDVRRRWGPAGTTIVTSPTRRLPGRSAATRVNTISMPPPPLSAVGPVRS